MRIRFSTQSFQGIVRQIALLACAATGLAEVSPARAQTWTVNHLLQAWCNPFEQTSFQVSCGTEHRQHVSTCTAICEAGTFTASGNMAEWIRITDRGVLGTFAHIDGTQFTAAPCGTGAGGQSSLEQIMTANDLVFTRQSNPSETGFLNNVTANLEFRGRIITGSSCVSPVANIHIRVCFVSCVIFSTLDALNPSSGVLAGYPNDNSTMAITSPVLLNTELIVPQSMQMRLSTTLRGVLCESPNPIATLFEADALLSLPVSGPVFNLPPDYTVNSVQLGIVDNHWIDPRVSISSDPVDQSTCPASSATFSVTAAGAGPTSFQWFRETAPKSNVFVQLDDGPTTSWDGGGAGVGAIVSGTTTGSMTIAADTTNGLRLTAAHALRFRCAVSNGCGESISNAASLSVNGCIADILCDGAINIDDLVLVITHWGATGNDPADITGNGVVDIDDLVAVITQWGRCS